MDCSFTVLPYQSTGYFSRIITDYLDEAPHLKSFYQHPVSLNGIREAIRNRNEFPVNRQALVSALENQYAALETASALKKNISLLIENNTYTVCTAHQPALFTGSLYFIYKILHTIKLASKLNSDIPGSNFVPVFYMGSEDADLEELSKFYLNGEKIVWNTQQTGAVGRMSNKGLGKLIDRISMELGVHVHGQDLENLLRSSFQESEDVQTGMLRLINQLFGHYGLVVLNADNDLLKAEMKVVFKDDLLNHRAGDTVSASVQQLSEYYKIQANPRAINLFYLKDAIRERIEQVGDEWMVIGTDIRFTREQLLTELEEHPGRFSPNVILRGLYQETILPNIAFIGGGGELAYWLELKALFSMYKVPFPMLILRNSFLLIDKDSHLLMRKLGISETSIFKPEEKLKTRFVERNSTRQLALEKEIEDLAGYYDHLQQLATAIDPTLKTHVKALKTRALKTIEALEKKFLRAEKRHYDTELRQLAKLKEKLFPLQGLQERIDNFMPYYARWGKSFIDLLYSHSFTLEQQFGILIEKEDKAKPQSS